METIPWLGMTRMSLAINAIGFELIKHFEGFSATPYKCPAGVTTIGYGHVIKPGEHFTTITQELASQILMLDIRSAEASVNHLIKVKLNRNQFSALVSFVFNLGHGNFASSTLQKVVNQQAHLDVPSELIKWRLSQGKPLKGLLRRRVQEALLYLS